MDPIDRQAAIDAVISLCDNCDSGYCGSCRVNYPGEKDVKKVLEDLPSVRQEQSDTSEFWRKRADYYSDLCMRLIAEMGKGVKIESVKISENGIEFIKEQPSAQPETCAYWDRESNLCALHRPFAQPLVIHCTDCEDWNKRQSILGFAISELPPAQPE